MKAVVLDVLYLKWKFLLEKNILLLLRLQLVW